MKKIYQVQTIECYSQGGGWSPGPYSATGTRVRNTLSTKSGSVHQMRKSSWLLKLILMTNETNGIFLVTPRTYWENLILRIWWPIDTIGKQKYFNFPCKRWARYKIRLSSLWLRYFIEHFLSWRCYPKLSKRFLLLLSGNELSVILNSLIALKHVQSHIKVDKDFNSVCGLLIWMQMST